MCVAEDYRMIMFGDVRPARKTFSANTDDAGFNQNHPDTVT